MQLSSVILVGPLRDHYWAIQTYVYHCSPTCRSQRGDWDCHIHRNDLAPPSHKHITAWTTDSWPVSLNTSNTCTHAAINQCCTGIQKSVFSVKSLMFRKFWCETKKGKWKNRLIALTDKEKKIENPTEIGRNQKKHIKRWQKFVHLKQWLCFSLRNQKYLPKPPWNGEDLHYKCLYV